MFLILLVVMFLGSFSSIGFGCFFWVIWNVLWMMVGMVCVEMICCVCLVSGFIVLMMLMIWKCVCLLVMMFFWLVIMIIGYVLSSVQVVLVVKLSVFGLSVVRYMFGLLVRWLQVVVMNIVVCLWWVMISLMLEWWSDLIMLRFFLLGILKMCFMFLFLSVVMSRFEFLDIGCCFLCWIDGGLLQEE